MMNMMRKRMLTGLVVLGLGAGSVAAYADKGGCGPDGMGGHPGFGRHMGSPERMKEHFEKRQSALHDKLKLNGQQEQAWNAYLNVLRPTQPPARPDRAEFDKLSTPERMQKMLGFMQDREKRMAAHIAATREFYATLTPEQQKIFDAEFARGPRHRR
jgi:protein CpxP